MLRLDPAFLIGYGCVTAAGQGASRLYESLIFGKDYSTVKSTDKSIAQLERVCPIDDGLNSSMPAKTRMVLQLEAAWHEARSHLSADFEFRKEKKVGVIFASTKGCIEDHIWSSDAALPSEDSLTPILRSFIERSGLRPQASLCVSNACSSVHVAMQLASSWLTQHRVSHVLVLAADQAGPFVTKGFAALKSFATERVTPFGAERQGIQLGEAATAILLAREPKPEDLVDPPRAVRLSAIDTCVEGHALTRSKESGETLARVCAAVTRGKAPSAIIAHGTGTEANDAMEDRAYFSLFAASVPITCTKWSVGHCLGASGAIDFIAASEALHRRRLFHIANTKVVDPKFRCNYLMDTGEAPNPSSDQALSSILVASAGFGGMHGAALLEYA